MSIHLFVGSWCGKQASEIIETSRKERCLISAAPNHVIADDQVAGAAVVQIYPLEPLQEEAIQMETILDGQVLVIARLLLAFYIFSQFSMLRVSHLRE